MGEFEEEEHAEEEEEEAKDDDEEEIVEEVGEIAHEDDVDERVEDADRGRNFTFVVEDDEHVAFVDGALEDDGLFEAVLEWLVKEGGSGMRNLEGETDRDLDGDKERRGNEKNRFGLEE